MGRDLSNNAVAPIAVVRKKLADATGREHYIETVWRRGYMMRDPEPNAVAWPECMFDKAGHPHWKPANSGERRE